MLAIAKKYVRIVLGVSFLMLLSSSNEVVDLVPSTVKESLNGEYLNENVVLNTLNEKSKVTTQLQKREESRFLGNANVASDLHITTKKYTPQVFEYTVPVQRKGSDRLNMIEVMDFKK